MDGKICPGCKVHKPADQFHKSASKKSGLQTFCKVCANENTKKFFKTEKGKAAIKRSNQSEKGKQARRRYDQSEKGKARVERLRKTETYKRTHIKHNRIYRKKYKEKVNAHCAVQYAVKAGKIPPVNTLLCLHCGATAQDYHHHNGYAPEHKIDVIPLCKPCHRLADKA